MTNRKRIYSLSAILLGAITYAIADGVIDADQDGLPDNCDACPTVTYSPHFDLTACDPIDQNPANDFHPG